MITSPSDTDLRLFIGIPISNEWKKSISRVKAKNPHSQPEISWTSEENLHMTVLYFGATPIEMLENLKQMLVLGLSKTYAFKMEAESFCLAPPGKAPRMLWLKGEKNNRFKKLSNTLARLSLQIYPALQYRKDPIPHVTLARFKADYDISRIKLDIPLPNTNLPTHLLYLYESRPGPNGRRYIPLWYFDLKSRNYGDLDKE